MQLADDLRPQLPPRTASSRPSRTSLTLDLSNLPPLAQPTAPSNTLLFTNLQRADIFQPDNLQTIRALIAKEAPIHAFSPLRSFRRIQVSFFSDAAAVRVRSVWDGEAVMGDRCRVYFGQPTPTDDSTTRDGHHLALPDAGKLFFISPPPSPPHGWEGRLEEAPNKMVHAEDLADALARLRHHNGPPASPVSPADSNAPAATRSRSSTLIFQPRDHGCSPDLPCVTVDDMTDEPDEMSPIEPRPIAAHTSRPPVELMFD